MSIDHRLVRSLCRVKRNFVLRLANEPIGRLPVDIRFKERFWKDLSAGKFQSMIKESSKGQSLRSSLEAFNVMKPLFADEDDVEKMFFVFMDQKNNILSIDNLFKGSIAGAAIYPREVIKKIIRLKANSIVLAHNHPSGDPNPSKEDKDITMRLLVATYSIDVTILDHIIIGSSYYSMADEGILQRMRDTLSDTFNGGQYVQSIIES